MANNIEIKIKNGFCVWNVEFDNELYNTTMDIEYGCMVDHMVNGCLEHTYTHGVSGREKINAKKEKRDKNKIELIAANTKVFDYPWGISGVPYRDAKTKVETEVGMNGTYQFVINSAYKVRESIGKSEITPRDIAEKLRATIVECGKSELSEKLKHYDNVSIIAVQDEMSANIFEKFSQVMWGMGIELKSFNVAGVHFPEEFFAAKQQIADQKKAEDAAFDAQMEERNRERMEAFRRAQEADNIAKIIEASKNK